MTAHESDTIVLAPNHTITRRGVRAKQKELENIPLSDAVNKVKSIGSGTDKITGMIDEEFFGSDVVFDRYRSFHAQKNWPSVDKLILDALAAARPNYSKFLDAEEWVRAFNSRLCAEVGTARAAYRWLDPSELKSYLNGTFESKAESGRARRGFKALSMNFNLNFELRKVMLEVPLDPDIRKSIRCVHYTVMPRDIEEMNEKISDPKNAAFVKEAEVRVPDGTDVPPGSAFIIEQGTPVDQDVVMALEKIYVVVR